MQMEGGKAFIDTGTTFVYFDKSLYSAFVRGITKHCEKEEDSCGGKQSY